MALHDVQMSFPASINDCSVSVFLLSVVCAQWEGGASSGRPKKGGKNRTRKQCENHRDLRNTTRCAFVFNPHRQTLGIVPDEEWDEFIATLRKPLPSTFRITKGSPFSEEIKQRFVSLFLGSNSKKVQIHSFLVNHPF